MLIHSVYFWLKPDLTDAQRTEFRRGVETLATIKSVEKVYVGAPAGVPDRPIVDKTFGIALTVVCTDVAAHNSYQVDPIHLKFIENCKQYWARVQIYDAE
ncbi:MAG TPA: Dabb family protein [Opitutaceae bacterium]|nr:Dabb family protein [Opitutaceae bacterium]